MTTVLATLLPFIALFQPAAPSFSAELKLAHESVPPGGQSELAIILDVEEDYHIYHPIILDTGAPTEIKLTAPNGVTFGPLRYPVPDFGTDADLAYLSLEGEIVVLATIKVADDVPPGNYRLAALVQALACKELCIPVDATGVTALQIAAGDPEPINQKLFETARAELAKPLADAPYIKGSEIKITDDTLSVGEKRELELTVRVKAGHHIQDRDPGTEFLIPSRLFIETINGVKLHDQQWPKPKIKNTEYFGQVREQSGTFTIKVPVEITDQAFKSGAVTLRALFTYQCCTDAGQCFPPEAAFGVINFTADTSNEAVAAGTTRGTWLPTVEHVEQAPTNEPIVAGPTGDGRTRSTSATPAAITLDVLLWNLLAGFLGGLILNIMPCVFPVISIKIISFVNQAGEDRARILKLGLAFCAGIMVWFWLFAILTSAGEIPWQYPPVVVGLTAFIFLFALNLFGVFEIILPGSAATRLDEVSSKEGYGGAFMKGFLATLLGTACTAPFFAGAAAYAATHGPLISLVVFTAAGLGMSSPYVFLSAFPGWLKILPKPGAWMVVFKQAMGFILVATAVWLLTIVGDQLGASGVVWTAAFLSFVALSAWLVGQIGFNWRTSSRLITWASAVAVIAFGGWFSFGFMYKPDDNLTGGRVVNEAVIQETLTNVGSADWTAGIPWQAWRPGLPEALADRGYTTYVDFTATWCVTCQANKASSLEIQSTRARMREMGIIPLKGDYTNRDPDIQEILLAWQHNSVPLNLVYAADPADRVVKLPVVLTPGTVAEALDDAGASTKPLPAPPETVAGLDSTQGVFPSATP